MLNGEIYIFGGSSNFNKIARLQECEFKELSIQLEDRFDSVSGALITFSNRVYLCFFAWPYNSCEEFDGEQTVKSNFTTNHAHCYGSLGVYNDQLLALGAGDWPGEGVRNKVEILKNETWIEIADFPLDIQLTSTITVPEGMLVIGGWNQESGLLRENPNSGGFYKQVYLLSDNVWSLVGNLNEPVSDATVIRVGEWIVTVAGDSANNNVERFKWNGQEIENVETISKHENTILRPIAFQSYKNFCTFQN
ncbi:unnamed protein product [Oikopleura dioica]|uniref:Uncharacterized protein n=1 Tax=Oikopleura dioica TaxID=34765 RepID=E4YH65_OIKDI|nr:unnamed protein product [Oikopleura dioica]